MRSLSLAALLVLSSCATPVPPPGGPPDETPPRVVESFPEPDAVNVGADALRITFSEYVEEGSFAQAFSITPEFAGRPEFVWSRRGVEVRFPEPLRENTTYVVTLDTNLRDSRGVALQSPVTLAFSTGPTISAGAIAGLVVTPESGAPAAGVDVFAYALTDSTAPSELPDRPAYRTQTDQAGNFRLDYLTEQLYFVAAVRDQNRNSRPDQQEAFAPPPVPAIPADSTPVALNIPWIITRIDTTQPRPIRIQSLSKSRHVLRFSEPVQFIERSPEAWALVDSVSGEPRSLAGLYMNGTEPRDVYFRTEALSDSRHSVRAGALADTSWNMVVDEPAAFTPSAAADTAVLRFRGFLPTDDEPLPRDVEPGLRFTEPVDQEALAETVTVLDSTGTPLAFSAVTDDGTLYRILPDRGLEPGGRIEIRVAPPADSDSVHTREYERLALSETGEITGVVTSDVMPIIVHIIPDEVPLSIPEYTAMADSSGTFVARGLPAGTYRLRAFADADADGRWDGGLLMPYLAAEPITWRNEPVRVRARWETAMPDTLHIPPP